MPRPDVNRAGEMLVFVQVVEQGGFSPAARQLSMTPSAVSKLIARLEARLGTQLLHRSTRLLQLTAEGELFHERCVRILAEIDEAERSVAPAADPTPRGRVTLNTSSSIGTHVVIPLLPRFAERFPLLALDLHMTDRVVNLMEERADLAIRWGPLPASDLLARRLGQTGQVIVAAPSYLVRHGTPRKPSDLAAHETLGFTYARRRPDWPLKTGEQLGEHRVRGRFRAHDGEVLRHMAVAGIGIVRLSRFQVQSDLDAGRLVELLARHNPGDTAPIHAVFLGHANRVPPRVRATLDFLIGATADDPRLNAR